MRPKVDPHAITLTMAAIGMLIAREEPLGVSFGHDETRAAAEAALTAFDAGMPKRCKR